MIRITTQRLLASAARPALTRPISSTASLGIRVKHADGSKTSPAPVGSASTPTPPAAAPAAPAGSPTPNPKANAAPSPAPAVSKPPSKISTPPANDAKIHNAGGAARGPAPASAPSATASAASASIPPSPTAASASSSPVPPAQPTPAPTTPDSAAQAETEEPADFSKLPSLDVDSEMARLAEPAPEAESKDGAAGAGGPRAKRTGAGRKEYVSSVEKQRRAMLRYGIGALLVGGVAAAYFTEGEKVVGEGEKAVGGWERLKNNTNEFFDYFNKPAFKTLLPDPLPAPHQRPYTLLIDMEGMLVTSTWDRQNGWRTAKRPGVDYFLAYLSLFYEIVLFTHQPLYTAAPVAEKLDPFQAYLPYKLFRDSTRTVNGKVVKDLEYLNRDLSKVIMLDTNPEHAALQPDNAIIIPPWEGKGGDSGLVDLIPFLESIAYYNVKDVRPTLKHYQGKNIAQEYAKIEEEQKKQATLDWERAHPSSTYGAGSNMLSSMFGSVSATGRTRPNQPMTYIEQKRAESQRMYQEEQKYWRENSEAFKKLIEEDKQKQLAEMKGSLWGFMGGQAPKEAVKEASK